MATGRRTVVVGQVIDPDAWGNPLWDQSVQTYTSAIDRTSQFPAPKQGAVTWLEDVKRLEVFNGTTWTEIPIGPAAAWAPVPLNSAGGVSHYTGAPYTGLFYLRIGLVAYLSGAVQKSGGFPAGFLIGTLPVGYRPLLPTETLNNAVQQISIRSDGSLTAGNAGLVSPSAFIATSFPLT